jgi:hypothetical protein
MRNPKQTKSRTQQENKTTRHQEELKQNSTVYAFLGVN